jgi:rRNA-processing protein FCF1
MKNTVIMDTSSILYAASKNSDPFEAIMDLLGDAEMIISSGVINELRMISKRKKGQWTYAAFALSLIKEHDTKGEILIINSRGNVDAWIVGAAKEKDSYVCTNDSKLREALKKRGVKVITISEDGMAR